MRKKINVLFLAWNPFRDRAPLRLDEEVRAIDRALPGGRARHRLALVAHFGTRTGDLRDALLCHDPQIVHFAGQGDDRCVLYLGDGHGRPVGTEALRDLFGTLREWIRVVILNGHDPLPTVAALGGAVDYVIGMDRPLGDPSAIAFAAAFYGALAMGRTVQAAFDCAVSRLEIEGHASTAPVLCVRPGVDPAVPLVAEPVAAFPPRAPAGRGHARSRPASSETV